MANGDESILGLLLRAHARVAAQAHGEEFITRNVNAKCHYETALNQIHGAIQAVTLAERVIGFEEGQKKAARNQAPEEPLI